VCPFIGVPRLQPQSWINENKNLLTLVSTTVYRSRCKPAVVVRRRHDGDAGERRDGHTVSLDYTFIPTNAIGFYLKQEENGKDILMVTPEFNTLLKRWNLPDGQGNFLT